VTYLAPGWVIMWLTAWHQLQCFLFFFSSCQPRQRTLRFRWQKRYDQIYFAKLAAWKRKNYVTSHDKQDKLCIDNIHGSIKYVIVTDYCNACVARCLSVEKKHFVFLSVHPLTSWINRFGTERKKVVFCEYTRERLN